MLAYWLLLLIPSLILFSNYGNDRKVWAMVIVFGMLIIGLRFEVGADWGAYLRYSYVAEMYSFTEALQLNDPAYMALNWLSGYLGFGIIGVNLTCGLLFMIGLMAFARQQPIPWLAVVVAVPYLLCVVVMGYSRQGVALGFVLFALSVLRPGNEVRFILLVLAGALFHKSAVVAFLFLFLIQERILWWHLLIALPFVGMIGYVVAVDALEAQWHDYVTNEMSSSGALIRVIMNAVPAIVGIGYISQLKSISHNYRLLWWMGLISLGLVPLAFTTQSTTVVDRLALYLSPIQLALWPQLVALQKTTFIRAVWAIGVVLYSASVLYVWMNYADHAFAWLPYQFYPWVWY